MTWEISSPGSGRRAQRGDRALPARPARPPWALVALLAALLAATFGLLAAPAGAQGATVDVEGAQVTVDVSGVPGHQVRVELQDDSIASTALIGPTGTTSMVFELPPGEYQLEVITFDPAGTPTSVGTFPAVVAGPPPPAPGVEVTPGSPGDNRTIVRLTGPAGTDFEVEVVREGERQGSESGTLAEDGTGTAVFLLESGPYGYIATLRNAGGVSEGALAEFTVDIGTPAPPVLELLTPQGQNPATVKVTGPAGGSIELTAEMGDERVTEEADLDRQGVGQVELDLPDSGTWQVTGIATDIADQRSEPATLEGGIEAVGDGPPLTLERISADGGQFGFSITTSVGTTVTVDGDVDALRFQFTAEEETTEYRIDVPEGEHVIEVTAADAFGNTTVDSLSSSDSGGGGIPWGVLGLIILGILAALGVFAFVRRQELIDWWNTRQYH
jgi:hypothetical protein